ncbi:MAG: hypothetical protein K6G01_04820 [Eubacterium sp.]|nr:hypothetical protein [Eubacterium sp.]
MKVLIHMGNYKTGSSAIQDYLYAHGEELVRRGIYYGQVEKHLYQSHAYLACAVLKKALEGEEIWASEPEIFAYVDKSAEQLMEEMVSQAKSKNCHTVVISQEGLFCELLRTLSGLRKSNLKEAYDEEKMLHLFHDTLHHLLNRYFTDIQILIFLRRQDEYLESQYKQCIKWPWKEQDLRPAGFYEFVKLNPVRLHYKPVLDYLAQLYGVDALCVCGYGKDTSSVLVIQKLLCLEHNEEQDDKIVNPSLNLDATEFRRKYVKIEAVYNEEMLQALLEYSKKHPDGQLTYIDDKMWQRLKETYEEENRQIAMQYIRGYEQIPDFKREGTTLYKGLLVEQLEEIFALFR